LLVVVRFRQPRSPDQACRAPVLGKETLVHDTRTNPVASPSGVAQYLHRFCQLTLEPYEVRPGPWPVSFCHGCLLQGCVRHEYACFRRRSQTICYNGSLCHLHLLRPVHSYDSSQVFLYLYHSPSASPMRCRLIPSRSNKPKPPQPLARRCSVVNKKVTAPGNEFPKRHRFRRERSRVYWRWRGCPAGMPRVGLSKISCWSDQTRKLDIASSVVCFEHEKAGRSPSGRKFGTLKAPRSARRGHFIHIFQAEMLVSIFLALLKSRETPTRIFT